MLRSDAMVDGESEEEASISKTIALDLVGLSRKTGSVFRCQDSAAVAITQGGITRSEVKYVWTINVAEIQKRADALAKNYRDLDARIQELNWQAELVE